MTSFISQGTACRWCGRQIYKLLM